MTRTSYLFMKAHKATWKSSGEMKTLTQVSQQLVSKNSAFKTSIFRCSFGAPLKVNLKKQQNKHSVTIYNYIKLPIQCFRKTVYNVVEVTIPDDMHG